MKFKTRLWFLTLSCTCLAVILLCSVFNTGDSDSPTVYAITPTYDHVTQKAEFVRLVAILKHVENFFWIVVEDKEKKSEWLEDFLYNTGLRYVHLNAHTPDAFRPPPNEPKYKYPRGIEQRNAGLTWLRKNGITDGVLFFMDDDNVYDPIVFEEMRSTQKVSIWPVGFAGDAVVESPVLSDDGKVVGFIGGFGRYRMFPVDMAGFAVNLQYVTKSDVSFIRYDRVGVQETKFLENLGFQVEDLEPRGEKCTRVLAWHTKTKEPTIKYKVDWKGGHV